MGLGLGFGLENKERSKEGQEPLMANLDITRCSEETEDHELTDHVVCAELIHFVSVQVVEKCIVHRVGKLADLNQAGRKDRSTVTECVPS